MKARSLAALASALVALVVSWPGSASTEIVLDNAAATETGRLFQLGMGGDCFEEVFFEKISIIESPGGSGFASSFDLALGVYEQRVKGEESVLESQHVVLFGVPEIGSPSPWMEEKPLRRCDWPERIKPREECLADSRCLQRWRILNKSSKFDKHLLESVQIRLRERMPSTGEIWRYPNLYQDSEEIFREVFPGNAVTPESIWPAVLFSNGSCSEEVFFAHARRSGQGVSWSLKPILGIGASEIDDLVAAPPCTRVGPSSAISKCVLLENKFITVRTRDSSKRKSKSGIGRCFDLNEPWIFESREQESGEKIVAANIFLSANQAVAGFASIFPWLSKFFKKVPISQRRTGGCKAKWHPLGIELPLTCDRTGFRPKGLCPEVVTHELVHELSDQLMILTTGQGLLKAEEGPLWEALADYFAVSFDGSLNGTYGALCGADFRSIEEGLFSPALERPESFLVERFGDDNARKGLLISGALFDLPAALTLQVTAEEKRRIVDRLVVLSLMMGGHQWREFIQRFVELSELLLPDQVDAICSIFWDEHHLAVQACAGRTNTTVFDIEHVDLQANPIRVDGFLARGKKEECSPPVISVGNQHSRISRNQWSLKNHFVTLASLHSGQKEGVIEVTCPRQSEPLRQTFKVRGAAEERRYPLRAPAIEIKLSSSSGGSELLSIATRDSSGGLSVITDVALGTEADMPISAVWYPAPRIKPDQWDLMENKLQATNLDGGQLEFDIPGEDIQTLSDFEIDDSEILDGLTWNHSEVDYRPFRPHTIKSIPGHVLDPLVNRGPWRRDLDIFRHELAPGPKGPVSSGPSSLEITATLAGVEYKSAPYSGVVSKSIEPKRSLRVPQRSKLKENFKDCDYDREISDPPGLIWNFGQDSEYALLFFDSKCQVPPSCLVGPDNLKAALTCDGFLKVFQVGEAPLTFPAPGRYERVFAPGALASEDVDGDEQPELVVGPISLGVGDGVLGELRALNWTDGTPIGGQWPILTELMITTPPVFENLDDDKCLEVVLAGSEVEVWKPGRGLTGCAE